MLLASLLPAHERAAIIAGASAGRLDKVMQLLAEAAETEARVFKSIRRRLIPILILWIFAGNVAVIIDYGAGSLGQLSGRAPISLIEAAVRQGVVWGGITAFGVLVWLFVRMLQRAALRSALAEALLLRIPIIGSLHTARVLNAICAGLGAQFAAGVNPAIAFRNLLGSGGSAAQDRAILGTAEQLLSGQSVARSMAAQSYFPEDLLRRIQVAESIGKLDEELNSLGEAYLELVRTKMETLIAVLPRLVWVIVAAAVVALVVRMILGYVGAIESLLNSVGV
jgi:type II secretory pathway component PulF